MQLTIVTPEKRVIHDVPVQHIRLTTQEGEIEILTGHTSLLGVLSPGPFVYLQASGETKKGFISTGFFSVQQECVMVAADTCEFSFEIDFFRAQKAEKLAKEQLEKPHDGSDVSETELKKYQLKLQRALIRQALSKK